MNYQKISKELYAHYLWGLGNQLDALWNTCRCYGLDDIVDGNIKTTIEFCENFAMAVRGKQKPIGTLTKRKPRATE